MFRVAVWHNHLGQRKTPETIHYMDAAFVNRAGASTIIKNAICIHEEDAGILFKHSRSA
jgi:Cu2+-containing amine oxidase